MRRHGRAWAALAWFAGWALPAAAGPPRKSLEVYWVDAEGGAATLIVTPAGESILVDAGYPDERGAARIHKVAIEAAGLKAIDHLIVTHFHVDHFGGAAALSELMPVGRVYDNGIPELPAGHKDAAALKAYAGFKAGRRTTLTPGDALLLAQAAERPAVSFRLLGTRQEFVQAAAGAGPNPECAAAKPKPPDTSDNANSTVWLLEYGSFRLFDGGDLTWNTEAQAVCPVDRVGAVDVYQVDHHGLDASNNPVLVRSLAPTVAVMSNGAQKGSQPESFATLKATSSIRAVYQIHKNLREDRHNNTGDEYIANLEERCQARYIKLSVDADGKEYTVEIPGRGHKKTYRTRRK